MAESLNGEAVTKISDLARNAAGFEIKTVDVKATGLPESFPVLFDKRQGGVGLKTLREEAERWRIAPERKCGTALVTTLNSFVDLTNRFKDENSAVFAQSQWPNPSLVSVLNYNAKSEGEARFGDHRVKYDFPITDEFKAWAEQDGETMSQADFAEFIEEHAAELSNPTEEERKEFEALFNTKIATPSELIVLSRGMQVNVAGRVKNATTLQSGEVQLEFVEEHQNSKGEKLVVPGLFIISMPAFIDGEAIRIPARLRYRTAAGSVVWFYQMYRWKQLIRDRVVADLDWAKGETALPTFEGAPEA